MKPTTHHSPAHSHNGLTVDIDIDFREREQVEIVDVRLNSMTVPTAIDPDIMLTRADFSRAGLNKLEDAIQRGIELDDDYLDSLPSLATPDDDDGAMKREERAA